MFSKRFYFFFVVLMCCTMTRAALGVPSSIVMMLGVGGVTNVEYSPDGRWLALGSGRLIALFDAKSLQQRSLLLPAEEGLYPPGIHAVAFSPNSKFLVSLSRASKLTVWDVQTATKCLTFLPPKEVLDPFWTSVAFSPDGRWLALVRKEISDEIVIWDMSRQAVQTIIRPGGDFVQSVVFHPSGKVLAGIVSGREPLIRDVITFWDIRTGVKLETTQEEIEKIAYSPDGRLLAVSSYDGTLQFLRVINPFKGAGEVLHTLKGNRNPFLFSPNSQLLAINKVNEVQLWDTQAGTLRQTIVGERIPLLTFSPDSQTLVMLESFKGLQFWDIESGRLKATIPYAGGSAMHFSRDGQILTFVVPAINAREQIVRQHWNTWTGAPLPENEEGLGEPLSDRLGEALSPDGQFFALGQFGSVTVWNATTGDRLSTWQSPQQDSFTSLTFSPNNRFLAAAQFSSVTQEASIIVWEVSSGVEYRRFQSPPAEILAFSPDGNTLAVGDGNTLAAGSGTIQLRDIRTGEITQTLQGHPSSVASLAFSPDGRILASGGGIRVPPFQSDFTVRLWDVSTGEELQVLKGHEDIIETLAFSPDGRLLASGGIDNTAKLWLVSAGKELLTLQGYSDDVRSLAFSPDGRRLAVGAGEVLVWNLAELLVPFPPTTETHPKIEPPVSQTVLLPNFPNPFNAETWMPYTLSQATDVQIRIYDVQGRLVRLLALGHRAAGRYNRHCNAAYWDGRNDSGEPVTSGVYFYSLQTGDFRATRKMVLKK